MSLWVRLNCNFFTHRKTIRLRSSLGNDALWIPPRIWAYAAETHPDGNLGDITAGELAIAIGYTGDAPSMLQALLEAGFLENGPPLLVHGWADHNSYHEKYSARAKHAAAIRWQKERTKEKGEEKRRGETSNASGMLGALQKVSALTQVSLTEPPLSPAERITREKELERVEAEIQRLVTRNEGGPWSAEDRLRRTELKERRMELLKMLGMKA